MNYILGILYLIFTSLGVLFMKLGGNSLKISFTPVFNFQIGLLTFLGFVFYVLSFIMWQRLLVTNNLSFIIPLLTGLAQVIAVIIAFTVFKENISIYNLIGIAMIIGGIILLAIKR